MTDVGRHPRIQLLTLSEVVDVKGYVGNFKVKILKKARYVDETSCTACGDCKPVCPTKSISSGKIFFKIDVGTCTECEGHNDTPLCVDVCPSSCISPA